MKATIALLLCLILSGCTMTIDNPFEEKASEPQKVLIEKIKTYELLEQEAQLIHDITALKTATAQAGKPHPDEKLVDEIDQLKDKLADLKKE